MKRTFYKNLIVIALLFLTFWACTYNEDNDIMPDYLVESKLIEEFLAFNGQDQGVKQLIKGLRVRNLQTPFISPLIRKYGFPSWNDAIILKKSKQGESQATAVPRSSKKDKDISEVYSQIMVPILKDDSVTSVMIFVPREGKSNLYQFHSKRKLEKIGKKRKFNEEELTLGALFLKFENLIFNKDKVKIESGTFSVRNDNMVSSRRKGIPTTVSYFWIYECFNYRFTPDPDDDFWGTQESIEATECEWILAQVTTTLEPIPDGPDDSSEVLPGPGGLPDDQEVEVDSTDTCKTNKEEIQAIFSNASEEKREKFSQAINDHAKRFGIDTQEELSHFIGQVGKESLGLSLLAELSSYDVPGLLSTWPTRFSETNPNLLDPNEYERNGQKTLNKVYANRLGNGDVASGDGYRYRGRGAIQITGKEKYIAFTNFYQQEFNSDLNFVTNPELIANDVYIGTIVALWFWKRDVAPNIERYDDSESSIKEITASVRNSTQTWNERKVYYSRAKNEIDCIN